MKKDKIINKLMSTGRFTDVKELQEQEKGDLEILLGMYLSIEDKNKTRFIVRASEIMCNGIRLWKIQGNEELLQEAYVIAGALNREIKQLCEYLEGSRLDVEAFMDMFGITEDEDYWWDFEESFYENLIPTGGPVGKIIRTALIHSESVVKEMFKSARG